MKTQHFHSPRGCLSYITYDPIRKEAALIDPSIEIGQATYVDFLTTNDLVLKYIIETHTHADHISIAKEIKSATSANIVRHKNAPSPAKDVAVEGGEKLLLGDEVLQVLNTPGHTNESISLYNGNEVFTGDTLLIGGTGRTDFQIGDSEALYQSLHHVIENLPAETLVRPGHNYQEKNQALLADELHTNPRVMMCESEFVNTLDTHHPPKPELFAVAIEANSK